MNDGDVSHLVPGLALPRISLPATTAGEKIRIAEVEGTSALIVYPWTGRPEASNSAELGRHPWSTRFDAGARGLSRPRRRIRMAQCRPVWLEPADDRLAARDGRAASAYLPDPERCGRTLRLRALPTQLRNQRRELPEKTYARRFVRHHCRALFFPVPDPASTAGHVLQWLKRRRRGAPRGRRPRCPRRNSRAGPSLPRDSRQGAACRG